MDPKSWVARKIDNKEFTFDEFSEVLFPSQPKMRDCSISILKYIKEKGPSSLNQIIQDLQMTRGTAYDTVKYLKRWGILERSARYAPLKLSREFGRVLRKIADSCDSVS